jgi:hypothetical protein
MISAHTLEGLSRRGIARILWLHRTDRWYFGDFLRHAGWLHWLKQTFPQASIDLASHPAYLPLYADDRFGRLLDARTLGPSVLGSYDLVLQPAAFEPESIDEQIPLLITTWDAGWALRINGRSHLRGPKAELNYFRAAHPSSIFGGRDTWTTPVIPTQVEIGSPAMAFVELFGDTGSIVVYNPTSSNAFTRETALRKEVDNALSTIEHAQILHHLVVALPDHHFIVGSALKPGDTENAQIVQAVTSLTRSRRVRSIAELLWPPATTLRGFAAILGSDRVCSTTGAGTGTNTHLAALSDTCSFSIERGADAQMMGNWLRPNDFQMGSFRWRSPSTVTGVHTLDWSSKTRDALTAAARGYISHHWLAHRHHPDALFTSSDSLATLVARFADSWTVDPAGGLRAAMAVVRHMTPAAEAHYGHFGDEAAYLRMKYGITSNGVHALVEALAQPGTDASSTALGLFEDSNLHKLLVRLAARAVPVLAPVS